jgi:HlyD family secretion protein/adhesin transport system membrane fusion protein
MRHTPRKDQPQARYLAQSIRLEETEPPGILSKLTYSASALLLLLVLWAAITQIDEVARSEGKVVPRGNVQAIQHFEGGIVSEILVSEGQMVKAGQTILRLSPIQTKAQLDQSVARRAALILAIERNRAIAEKRMPAFETLLTGFATMIADQSELFSSEVRTNDTQHLLLERQYLQKQGEVTRLTSQFVLKQEEARLLNTELVMRRDLFERGLSTRDGVFAVERQASRATTEMKDTQGRLAVARDSAVEAKKRIEEFDQNLVTGSLTMVGDLTQQLTEIEESIKGLRDIKNRLRVAAPVDGIVKGLSVNAINAVVRPGETLLELVPTGTDVIVETRLSPLDIGHVLVGQDVDVRVTAFDFSRYGALKGVVEKISATTFQAEDGTPYYKATVSLDRHFMGDNPNFNQVLPGMVVQANVITGSKSLLDYLLKPVNRGLSRSFQER